MQTSKTRIRENSDGTHTVCPVHSHARLNVYVRERVPPVASTDLCEREPSRQRFHLYRGKKNCREKKYFCRVDMAFTGDSLVDTSEYTSK